MKTILAFLSSVTTLIKMGIKAIRGAQIAKKVQGDNAKIDEAFNENDAEKLRDTFRN